MSDSFADLWSSLEPAKQSAKLSSLGAVSKPQATKATSITTTTTTPAQPLAKDAFSMLAAASSSSRPTSRSLTPSVSLQPQRPVSSQSQTKTSQVQGGQGGKNVDAFGSLLSASFSSSNNPGNLSLAARQEAAMKEQRARLERERLEKAKEADAWSGLDLLAQGSSKSTPVVRSRSNNPGDFDFGDREDRLLNGSGELGSEGEGGDDILGMFAMPADSIPKRSISSTEAPPPHSKPTTSTNIASSDSDNWLFDSPSLPSSSSYPTPPDDDFLSPSPSIPNSRSHPQVQTPKASTSLFDILSNDFSLPSSPNTADNGSLSSQNPPKIRDISSPVVRSPPNSPGDFDLGIRQDGLLNGSGESGLEGEGGDDILGMLAKPVDSIPKRRISPTPAQSRDRSSSTARSRPNTPGDFDFGDREDRLLSGSGSEDEGGDHILGMLGKPADSIPKRRSSPTQHSSQTSGLQPRPRTSSPPPHIIGQIVEMGFSPEQARLALAATDSGLDVQQALEMLLANGAGSTEVEGVHSGNGRARIRQEDVESEDLGLRTRTRDEVQRPPMRRQASGSARSQPHAQASLVPGDLQERADKLISQASEIGLSVFSRANAFWKEGKERVQKVYEERASSSQGGAKGRSAADGRPRWMIDAQVTDEVVEGGANSANGGFRDREENEKEETILGTSRGPWRGDVRTEVQTRDNSSASGSAGRRTANLLDDEPTTYVSPSRRRNAAIRTPQAQPIRPTRVPSPEPLRNRNAISASPSTIATSNTHKSKGTELFRLGQYADAEKAYASALAALPENHLLLVPLHNNRAVTRLKTGDHAGAIEDCSAVLAIIGPTYHPVREAKVARAEEGATVDLADAVVKAYRRRAEAFEGREKWVEALKDWEAIIGCEWAAKARSEALNGIARCKKMISSEREPAPKPRKAPPPQTRRASPPVPQSFEAVQKLREANKAIEAEDAERLVLKDTVDARLLAWRGGKETNLRALLASLEAVLWPGLGWQKVGMHELVTPAQVKVRYMKAIAKLHPDKLNVSNTTLEQRMIANGVFAALNDAWLAFKQ